MSTVTERQSARPAVISIREMRKVYGEGEIAVHALRGMDLELERGDYLAVLGASGSGKTTLMNIIGCLDIPSSGRYLLDGIDVSSLDEAQLSLVRRYKLGFVFQSYNLIPRMSALANVELPMAYAGVRPAQRRVRALEALDMVGMSARTHHMPNELSGGQQQRVAVARALVTGPAVVLADEPTGNLDSQSSAEVLDVLDNLNAAGRTVIIITHEFDVAEHAKRSIHLADGRIISDIRKTDVSDRPPLLHARPSAS
jgi:putative ABC transport system ATP-binding protein